MKQCLPGVYPNLDPNVPKAKAKERKKKRGAPIYDNKALAFPRRGAKPHLVC
jgi:hypothetical protein